MVSDDPPIISCFGCGWFLNDPPSGTVDYGASSGPPDGGLLGGGPLGGPLNGIPLSGGPLGGPQLHRNLITLML